MSDESLPREQQLDSSQRRAWATGALAAGVVSELVRPLRDLREDLAVMVDLLDRHMAESRGPRGLSWKEVESLRQQLADNYLRSRKMTRLVGELSEAIAPERSAREPVDVNRLVEAAIALVRHRISEKTDVFVNLCALPAVRTKRGDLLLVVAHLVTIAADSASAIDDSAISISTRHLQEDDHVVITVADNGKGELSAPPVVVLEVAREVAAELGGVFSGQIEKGTGSALEIQLPVR